MAATSTLSGRNSEAKQTNFKPIFNEKFQAHIK
jgi:hypothetical protein